MFLIPFDYDNLVDFFFPKKVDIIVVMILLTNITRVYKCDFVTKIHSPNCCRHLPNSFMKPVPNCTNSRRLSNTKCHGNALQKLVTPILRSLARCDNAGTELSTSSSFTAVFIVYLKNNADPIRITPSRKL